MATPTVRDLGASLVRTFVATAVGVGLAWLAKNAHFVIDDATSAGIVQAFTGVVIGVYYLVVRFLETTVPAFCRLLALPTLPTSPAATGEVPVPVSGTVPTK